MKERQAVRLEIEQELQQVKYDRWWLSEVQRLARGRTLVTFCLDSQCRGGIARGLTPRQFLDEVLMDQWYGAELDAYDAMDDEASDLRDAYEEAERWERYEPNWWDDMPWRNEFEYGDMVYGTGHGTPS